MLDLDQLLSKKLLLVTGKGGIGKTVVAAGLGQLAAARGKRTLIIGSSPADQVAPLFGVTLPRHSEGLVADRLSAVNLDPPENFREYVVKYLGQKMLYDKVFSHKVVKSFINTVPGFMEVMLLGRLFYTCELSPAPRYDLVIFDSFASGHFLSLMTTPDAVLRTNLGGPLARETERVREFLADRSRCGVAYVCVPEELVVSETLEFLPLLHAKSPAALCGLFVNRMLPYNAIQDECEGRPGVVAGWMTTRIANMRKSVHDLKGGLLHLAAKDIEVPMRYLPDLGFIGEPVAGDFGESLFMRWPDTMGECR